MVLILSLQVLLSGDSFNPHREREAFIFAQPLRAILLSLESHSHGSGCRLKAGPNSSKKPMLLSIIFVFMDFRVAIMDCGQKSIFSGHSVLSKTGFQQHCQLRKVITPRTLIG
jgi:hypothetical protein